MALALLTGIAPSAWRGEDERDIATALDLLAQRYGRQATTDDDEPVMSG